MNDQKSMQPSLGNSDGIKINGEQEQRRARELSYPLELNQSDTSQELTLDQQQGRFLAEIVSQGRLGEMMEYLQENSPDRAAAAQVRLDEMMAMPDSELSQYVPDADGFRQAVNTQLAEGKTHVSESQPLQQSAPSPSQSLSSEFDLDDYFQNGDPALVNQEDDFNKGKNFVVINGENEFSFQRADHAAEAADKLGAKAIQQVRWSEVHSFAKDGDKWVRDDGAAISDVLKEYEDHAVQDILSRSEEPGATADENMGRLDGTQAFHISSPSALTGLQNAYENSGPEYQAAFDSAFDNEKNEAISVLNQVDVLVQSNDFNRDENFLLLKGDNEFSFQRVDHAAEAADKLGLKSILEFNGSDQHSFSKAGEIWIRDDGAKIPDVLKEYETNAVQQISARAEASDAKLDGKTGRLDGTQAFHITSPGALADLQTAYDKAGPEYQKAFDLSFQEQQLNAEKAMAQAEGKPLAPEAEKKTLEGKPSVPEVEKKDVDAKPQPPDFPEIDPAWFDDSTMDKLRDDASKHENEPTPDLAPAAEELAKSGEKAPEDKKFVLPEKLREQYIFTNFNLYQRGGDGKSLATFKPENQAIQVNTEQKEHIKAIASAVSHNGWESVTVDGTKEFRQAAWLELSARGIKVEGYQADKKDKLELERLIGVGKEIKDAVEAVAGSISLNDENKAELAKASRQEFAALHVEVGTVLSSEQGTADIQRRSGEKVTLYGEGLQVAHPGEAVVINGADLVNGRLTFEVFPQDRFSEQQLQQFEEQADHTAWGEKFGVEVLEIEADVQAIVADAEDDLEFER